MGDVVNIGRAEKSPTEQLAALSAELSILREEGNATLAELEESTTLYVELCDDYGSLCDEYVALSEDYRDVGDKYTELVERHTDLAGKIELLLLEKLNKVCILV